MFSFLNAVIVSGASGRVYATTEKSYYVAGELIKGTITCEALSGISASGIDLTVSGYEKTEWHDKSSRTEVIRPAYTDGNGQHVSAETRTIPQLIRHRAKKTFFAQKQRIYNIGGGTLNPGTYQFPFQYQLPDGIPGSFYERAPLQYNGEEYIDRDGISAMDFFDSDDEYEGSPSRGFNSYQRSRLLAQIQYKLKVTLDVNGFFAPDLHCRVPLVIHPKLEVNLQPAMQQKEQDVIVCCCFNKGKCGICARFDKLAYVAGETANVRADIKNASTSNLKTKVVLRRYLNLQSAHSKKNITEDIVSQQYDAVPEKTDSMDRAMPLQLMGEKVKPTTNGMFVKCNYEYLVTAEVSMGSDINLNMPVTIYAPQPPPPPMAQVAAPPMVQVALQSPVVLSGPSPQVYGMASPGNVQVSVQSQPQQQYPSQPQQQQQYQSQPQQQQQYPQQGMNMQINVQPQQQQYQSGGMQVSMQGGYQSQTYENQGLVPNGMQGGGQVAPYSPNGQPQYSNMQMQTTTTQSSSSTVNGVQTSSNYQSQTQYGAM